MRQSSRSSALADVARPLLAHGLSQTFGDAFRPLVATLSAAKDVPNAKPDATVVRRVLDDRARILGGVLDQYSGGKPFEPRTPSLTPADGGAALRGPWDAVGKQLGLADNPLQAFGTAAAQRVALSGVPAQDKAVLNNIVLMLALGALSYWAVGARSNDPAMWATGAVNRSGLVNILTSGAHIIERWRGDQKKIGEPVEPSSLQDGRLFNLNDLSRAMKDGSLPKSEVGGFHKLLPLQNLYYVRWLFDSVERGTAHAFGIPMRPTSQSQPIAPSPAANG